MFTSPSRLCFPSTPMVEPPVSSSTLEMVSPIPSQFSKVSPFLMLFSRTILLVEPLLNIWPSSSLRKVSLEKIKVVNPLGSRSSLRSKSNSLIFHRTMKPSSKTPRPPLRLPKTTSSQMAPSLPSTSQDSNAPKPSSNQDSSRKVVKPSVCTSSLSKQFKSAM